MLEIEQQDAVFRRNHCLKRQHPCFHLLAVEKGHAHRDRLFRIECRLFTGGFLVALALDMKIEPAVEQRHFRFRSAIQRGRHGNIQLFQLPAVGGASKALDGLHDLGRCHAARDLFGDERLELGIAALC